MLCAPLHVIASESKSKVTINQDDTQTTYSKPTPTGALTLATKFKDPTQGHEGFKAEIIGTPKSFSQSRQIPPLNASTYFLLLEREFLGQQRYKAVSPKLDCSEAKEALSK